jgi:hypothetical protein
MVILKRKKGYKRAKYIIGETRKIEKKNKHKESTVKEVMINKNTYKKVKNKAQIGFKNQNLIL